MPGKSCFSAEITVPEGIRTFSFGRPKEKCTKKKGRRLRGPRPEGQETRSARTACPSIRPETALRFTFLK